MKREEGRSSKKKERKGKENIWEKKKRKRKREKNERSESVEKKMVD